MVLYKVDYVNHKLVKIDEADIDWKIISSDWSTQTYEHQIIITVERTGLGNISYYGEYLPPSGKIYGGWCRHMVVSFASEEEFLIFKLSI